MYRLLFVWEVLKRWEILPPILRATKILPSTVIGIDPYFLVFKQNTEIPAPLLYLDFCRE